MAHSASGLGASFIIIAIAPIIASMVVTANFSLLIGANLWYVLTLAFGIGLTAAITAIGSGLNTEGTLLTFTLTFGTTLYGLFVGVTILDINAIPYNGGAIISGVSLLFYALGLFFLIFN